MSSTEEPRGWRVSDLAVSGIRTLVPVAVASTLTWAAQRWGVVIDEQISAQAVVWVTAGVIALYWMLARWLERRTGDGPPARAGRLLGRWLLGGVVRQPVYPAPDQRVVVVSSDGGMRPVR